MEAMLCASELDASSRGLQQFVADELLPQIADAHVAYVRARQHTSVDENQHTHSEEEGLWQRKWKAVGRRCLKFANTHVRDFLHCFRATTEVLVAAPGAAAGATAGLAQMHLDSVRTSLQSIRCACVPVKSNLNKVLAREMRVVDELCLPTACIPQATTACQVCRKRLHKITDNTISLSLSLSIKLLCCW